MSRGMRSRRHALRRGTWLDGWYRAARRVPSPNFGPRPPDQPVRLAVMHSISLPPGVYGGDAIERFFTNQLDPAGHPYFAGLAGVAVSAHFLVRRGGQIVQFVSVRDRAWHAGASAWRGVPNCNDYSLGIELEGLEGQRFEVAQYRAAARLLRDAASVWPVAEVVGHEHVAPGRKGDPGSGFDWQRLARLLRRSTPVWYQAG
ncbi:MAG: 1,6-anhydro-N-acetylmuramyl-L-alanine amidase AmpD [Pseudomonadota bacterium]